MAPVLEILGGGGELTHLGSSLPMSVVAAGHHSRPMVDGCMWAAVFVCGWPASFFGWLWWWCSHWWSLAFVGDHEGGGGEEHGGWQ